MKVSHSCYSWMFHFNCKMRQWSSGETLKVKRII